MFGRVSRTPPGEKSLLDPVVEDYVHQRPTAIIDSGRLYVKLRVSLPYIEINWG